MLIDRVACLLLTGIILTTGWSAAGAKDLAEMSGEEIGTLQRRLTDARCYFGPLDGKPSETLKASVKACPDQDPQLRIEVGMHTAIIKRIGVDAACSVIATGSDDKTVRLWSLPDGKPLRTFRLPIDMGNGGRVDSVAMSRDGRYLAAGGWDAGYAKFDSHFIYLFDLTNGGVQRIGSVDSTIFHLEFSPDGRRLAALLGGDSGVRFFSRETGALLASDDKVGNDSYGAAFGPDGSLYTTSFDGFVRRYTPDMRPAGKEKAPLGGRPYGIAVDPAGKRLAIGYEGTPALSLLDAVTLKPVGRGSTSDVTGYDLSSVAWFSAGNRFVAGGGAKKDFDGQAKQFLRLFDPTGRRVGEDAKAANDTIFDLKPCGTGVAYAAADPAFGLIGTDARLQQIAGPKTVGTLDKLGDAFTIAPDAQTLRFGLGNGDARPVRFSLQTADLSDAPDKDPAFSAPRTTGLKVTGWESTEKPKLNGKALALDSTETSTSLAIRRDGKGFVLGTSFGILSFNAVGKMRWRTQTSSQVGGVNLGLGDRVLVAAITDGTIRWYRWDDGRELLALFVNADDRRWVAWTPTGYYMASPGAEALIGWQVNRGWEQAPDFFPAARFRERFNRPDIVQAVLTTLDEDKAVETANASARRKPEAPMPIDMQLPPVITVASPTAGSSFAKPETTLDYVIRSPSGLAVDRIDVLIDGRPISADPGSLTRGLARVDPKPADAGAGPLTGRITVPLPERDVEVSLIARAGTLVSDPARVKLAYAGKPAPATVPDVLKPKLYLLAIGIADYQDPALRLGLAGKDARDFARALAAQAGGLYSGVETKLLIDREATRANVLDGLDWLERQATSRDVAAVFLAGHGQTDPRGDFWFLPADVKTTNLRATALSQDELKRTLQSLPSKALLFLDACHAGKAAGAVSATTRGDVDINSIVNDLASSENGVVTFASSTGRQLSQEHPDWGNGAFTKALVEGIGEAKANLLGRDTITLSELDAYVVNRVKELTKGTQSPVMTRPSTVSNFPIAVARR